MILVNKNDRVHNREDKEREVEREIVEIKDEEEMG